MQNLLIQTENAIALLFLLNDKNLKGKIDLIYIDPPFATNNHFTITNGRATTISNSKNGDIAYSDKLAITISFMAIKRAFASKSVTLCLLF